MVDWITDQVGITDQQEGVEIAQRGDVEPATFCLIPPSNPDATFQFDLSRPPFPASLISSIVMMIEMVVSNGHQVVVHCTSGIDHSPLVVAEWLRQRGDISLDEAYAMIRKVRPQVYDRRDWVEEDEHA